jgi:hypothetical protein
MPLEAAGRLERQLEALRLLGGAWPWHLGHGRTWHLDLGPGTYFK